MMARVLSQSIPTTFRLFLAFMFLIYGLFKILFGQFGAPPPEISAMRGEGFTLAWTFFGHSRLYEIFIGFGEVIAAALLLIPRTATLGALVYFPIALNVFIINYCYEIGVLDLSAILTLMCFLLLWIDRKKWFHLISRKEFNA